MTTPVPNRAARTTTQLGIRVPGDNELADGVTLLGDLADAVDVHIARNVRSQIAMSFLLMGA